MEDELPIADPARGEPWRSSEDVFSEKLLWGVEGQLWLLLFENTSSRFDGVRRLWLALDHDGRSGDGSQLVPPLGHGIATDTSLQQKCS